MKFLKKYNLFNRRKKKEQETVPHQEIAPQQVNEPVVAFDPEYVRTVLLDFSLDLKDKDYCVVTGYNDATNKYLIYIFKLTYDLPGVYRDTPEIRSLLADYNEVSGYSSFDSITSYHIGRNLSDIKFFNMGVRFSLQNAKYSTFEFKDIFDYIMDVNSFFDSEGYKLEGVKLRNSVDKIYSIPGKSIMDYIMDPKYSGGRLKMIKIYWIAK